MKTNIKYILSIAVLLIVISISGNAQAAIEAKTSARNDYNIYQAYQLCYDMKNPTSTLGNNNLDPHLSLSTDYGAWAYLGMSAYGTNGSMYDYGTRNYSSTTNLTGVLANVSTEVTSTISYGDGNFSGSDFEFGYRYEDRFFEPIPSVYTIESTRGMALQEIWGWYNSDSNQGQNSKAVVHLNDWYPSGGCLKCHKASYLELNRATQFRPVIWNK